MAAGVCYDKLRYAIRAGLAAERGAGHGPDGPEPAQVPTLALRDPEPVLALERGEPQHDLEPVVVPRVREAALRLVQGSCCQSI